MSAETKPPGQMQVIADRYQEAKKLGMTQLQLDALFDAILLLAKAEQQILGDLAKAKADQWDGKVG